MSIADQLFENQRLRLAAPDPEKDATIESLWTHDPEFQQLISAEPVRPFSPGQLKKKYEEAEKEKRPNRFPFAIRLRTDDRLIGFAWLEHIEWNNASGTLTAGLGASADRRQGYGTEALQMLLRYAFDELNLHRLSATTFEYNTGAQRWLEKAGFVLEARRRQAIHRHGRRWDVLHYGFLREDWKERFKIQS